MKPALAEAIVGFLSFSGEACNRVSQLSKFSERDWDRTLGWLDDTGLALYFLQKLKDTDVANVVPALVLSGLEKRLTTNQERVAHMARQFDFLNARFRDRGVRYAVVKGLSLVPQYCPDANLRHQGDFDYLIDDQSQPTAQRVLEETGYLMKLSISDKEFVFVMPEMVKPQLGDDQYQAQAPYAVELHLDIWDSDLHKVPVPWPLPHLDNAKIRQWHELTFPVLPDEDAFLVQVLHACNHLFTYWIRISWLWEIGYFLTRRADDALFWNGIEQRVQGTTVLQEFVVVVIELVAKLFGAPIPPTVRAWGENIRPPSRVWIDNYAHQWVFGEVPGYQFRLFPRAKLVLFLQQQYVGDASAQKLFARSRLLPPSQILHRGQSTNGDPSKVLRTGWRKRRRLLRRTLFHALSGFRYLCEIPRWRWLNRGKVASASLGT
ncbi:MAG TPA: nucleotidyltransferase family protein [Terriglobales bacterium]|nr:nucleotidyltransferase family protein [Terriglobales bacterium]